MDSPLRTWPGRAEPSLTTATTHSFALNFQDALINDSLPLSTLLGFDVPLIGDTQNQFLVAMNAYGDRHPESKRHHPTEFRRGSHCHGGGPKVYDKKLTPPAADPDFVFNAQSLLDGHTLIPGSGTIELTVSKIKLATLNSPTIPLISFGIPGIASVSAGLKFSIGASLSLAAKLGLDHHPGRSGFLGSLGLMSPTFIQPSITANASVVGKVSVAGFDIATLTGSIGLTLSLTLGLDNNVPGAIIPVSNLAEHVGTSIDVSLSVGIAASIPIIGNIFSYNYTLGTENIVNTIEQGIFLTDPPSFASGKFLPPAPAGGAVPADDPQIPHRSSPTGSTLVGFDSCRCQPANRHQFLQRNGLVGAGDERRRSRQSATGKSRLLDARQFQLRLVGIDDTHQPQRRFGPGAFTFPRRHRRHDPGRCRLRRRQRCRRTQQPNL